MNNSLILYKNMKNEESIFLKNYFFFRGFINIFLTLNHYKTINKNLISFERRINMTNGILVLIF